MDKDEFVCYLIHNLFLKALKNRGIIPDTFCIRDEDWSYYWEEGGENVRLFTGLSFFDGKMTLIYKKENKEKKIEFRTTEETFFDDFEKNIGNLFFDECL